MCATRRRRRRRQDKRRRRQKRRRHGKTITKTIDQQQDTLGGPHNHSQIIIIMDATARQSRWNESQPQEKERRYINTHKHAHTSTHTHAHTRTHTMGKEQQNCNDLSSSKQRHSSWLSLDFLKKIKFWGVIGASVCCTIRATHIKKISSELFVENGAQGEILYFTLYLPVVYPRCIRLINEKAAAQLLNYY